ncbi:histone-lysine N-methyltransferase NSD2 [Galendromus occidentalis]|uniref:Histone-lysine N-methyltransferase NSD2 n=1 Tax=Galendromus occidentalis TaxID=34638 RepID=A0AAJ6VXI6_9ACAR|nr:histone-lysine N-methyltransferase NSD2 [Galendromus occidentalis]
MDKSGKILRKMLDKFRQTHNEEPCLVFPEEECTIEAPPLKRRRESLEGARCENQENSVTDLNAIRAADLPRMVALATRTSSELIVATGPESKPVKEASTTSEDSGRGSTESLVAELEGPHPDCTLPYVPGDLLWVKMGKHPFWPCMIVSDENGEYFRQKSKYIVFHVRFFGNTDTFGWTDGPKRVLEFAGRDKYLETVEAALRLQTSKIRKELAKFYSINLAGRESLEKNWVAALSKADNALHFSPSQRLQRFHPSQSKAESTRITRQRGGLNTETTVGKDSKERKFITKQTREKPTRDASSATKRSVSPASESNSGRASSQVSKKKKVPKTLKKRPISRKVEHGKLSEAVCSTCLVGGTSETLKSCKCGNSFHAECLNQPAGPGDDGHAVFCEQCRSTLCAICEREIEDCVAIPATCCRRRYHMSCIRDMALRCKFSPDRQSIQECPRHVCLYCKGRGNLIHCVKCPVTYHKEKICVAASSQFLTPNQILCLRHAPPPQKKTNNLNYCFVCRESGSLICCDICPAVVHAACASEDVGKLERRKTWFCPDCVEGRFPVFGQVCWGKIGTHPWWPVKILHPSEMPENCLNAPHKAADLAVYFFGCPDSQSYGWLAPSKVFPYTLEDNGAHTTIKANQKRQYFAKALDDAKAAYKEFQLNLQAVHSKKKPPKFRKISSNKMVSASCRKRRLHDVDPCSCKVSSPCVDFTCTNRAVYVECSDDCAQREKCKNRRFQERAYRATKVFLTPDGRGWGLQAVEDLKKDDFVIEYIGEIIDSKECDRRLSQLHAIGDPNVYFLEADANYIIDAGPAGNEARFINHSCNPNLRTEKWTVNDKLCVGLFAKRNIAAGEELTFNYNMQCRDVNENICLCNASNCVGTLGISRKQSKSPTP